MKYLIRFFVWRIKKDYGERCEVSDLDEFKEMYANAAKDGELSKAIRHARCPKCQAYETVDFLLSYID